MMGAETLTAFAAAMQARGLIPPPALQTDGRLHRCPVDGGKPGNQDGAYVLFLDETPAGGFQNWRDGKDWQNWHSGKPQSHADAARWRQRQQALSAARKRDEAHRHQDARAKAESLWNEATPAVPAHPYLSRKAVASYGLRQSDGRLIVPMRDTAGGLHSLQFIGPDGTKRFLTGGRKRGCFHLIGIPGETLLIAEGFATAASLHAATGLPVAVAFDSGNLTPVATALRAAYPVVRLILCADDDHRTEGNPGMTQARAAAAKVSGQLVSPAFGPNRPEGATDFNDMAHVVGTAAVAAHLTEALATAEPDSTPETEARSQASRLVAFVEAQYGLFTDTQNEAYARHRETGEVRPIESSRFQEALAANFYRMTGSAARDNALREAVRTLAGLAREAGDTRPIFVRMAEKDGAYYLDLGEPGRSRAVKLTPGQWNVIENPPVDFLRPDTLQPLPIPEKGGSLAPFWDCVNIPETARPLVLAWLADCLRPETPFPVLEIIGEQGSAKSTTQSLLRRLIDPNACDLRAAPKSREDIFVSARVNGIVSYENISHLSADTQDALCVLATGAGYATRKLYSDADESIIRTKRPIALNGISAAVTAQDLIDRTLSVEIPPLTQRTEIVGLFKTFEAEHGRLLGAFLTQVAKALALLPTVHIAPKDCPRLIEFAQLGEALMRVEGRPAGYFLALYASLRVDSITRTLDASPVATALVDWWEDGPKAPIEMTTKALFLAVSAKRPDHAEAWPRTAKGFADALRRIAPALRAIGIEYRNIGRRGGYCYISLQTGENSLLQSPAYPESPTVPPQQAQGQDVRTLRTSPPDISTPPDYEQF